MDNIFEKLFKEFNQKEDLIYKIKIVNDIIFRFYNSNIEKNIKKYNINQILNKSLYYDGIINKITLEEYILNLYPNNYIFDDVLEKYYLKIFYLCKLYFKDLEIKLKNSLIIISNCIEFFINISENELYITICKLNRCKFTGTENIKILKKLIFENLPEISYISLEDESNIIWNVNDRNYYINLYILFILSKVVV